MCFKYIFLKNNIDTQGVYIGGMLTQSPWQSILLIRFKKQPWIALELSLSCLHGPSTRRLYSWGCGEAQIVYTLWHCCAWWSRMEPQSWAVFVNVRSFVLWKFGAIFVKVRSPFLWKFGGVFVFCTETLHIPCPFCTATQHIQCHCFSVQKPSIYRVIVLCTETSYILCHCCLYRNPVYTVSLFFCAETQYILCHCFRRCFRRGPVDGMLIKCLVRGFMARMEPQ